METPGATPENEEGASSSAEAFVQALALAVKRTGLYPEGHPARDRALDEPLRLLRTFLSQEDALVLGAKEDALLFGEETLDSLAAQELASRLYRRNVGVVRLDATVDTAGLERFAGLLQRSPAKGRSSQPPPEDIPGIVLEQVDYSSLVGRDEDQERPASLLEVLLRLQIGEHNLRDLEEREDAPEQIARILTRTLTAEEIPEDQRQELLEQLVEALFVSLSGGQRGGFQVLELESIRRLLGGLDRGLRVRVLAELSARLLATDVTADTDPGIEALHTCVPSADLLDAVGAMRRRGVPFSRRARRLTEALVSEVTREEAPRPVPDDETLQELGRLLRTDLDAVPPSTLDDWLLFLPDPRADDRLPEDFDDRLESLRPEPQRRLLLTMLVELVQVDGLPAGALAGIVRRLALSFRELIATGHPLAAGALLNFLQRRFGDELTSPDRGVSEALRQLEGSAAADAFLDALRLAGDDEQRGRIADLARSATAALRKRLVNRLSQHDDLSTRRLLFDLMSELGDSVADELVERLDSSQWFEVRNALLLLRETGSPEALPRVRRLADHPDQRVRAEATRFLLALDPDLSADFLTRLLGEADSEELPRLLHGLTRNPRLAAVPALLEILRPADRLRRNRRNRQLAIAALARIGDRQAALELEKRFAGGLRTQHSDEQRAFYESLEHYPHDVATAILQRGTDSRDSTIRELCERRLRGGSGGEGGSK